MYRFTLGTCFSWHHTIYEVTGLLPGDTVNLVVRSTGEVMTVPGPELVTALFDGCLQFGAADALEAGPGEVSDPAIVTLEDFSEQQQLVARYRHWVIAPLLALKNDTRNRGEITKRIEEVAKRLALGDMPVKLGVGRYPERRIQTSLSVPTIYRWLRAYERSGSDIRSLIPAWHKAGRENYLEASVDQIVEAVIDDLYLQRERHSLDDVRLEVLLRVNEANGDRSETEPLPAPSRSTIHRRVQKRDTETRLQGRHGKRATRTMLAQFGKMPPPERPLERVEIDHTPVDVILVDAEDGLPLGRPTLTSVLDVATRYPLGYYLGFEPPSYLAVCEALGYAFKPKGDVRAKYGTSHEWAAYGLPRTLVVDNGREFKGRSLEDACLSLGIILEYAPKRTPHFRGSIERLFRTQSTGLFHTLDGTTFSNIFARGDYRSLELAKLTLADIDSALHIFLLDYYAEQFHEGLQSTPAHRWEQFLADGFQPRLPASAADVDILLGRVLTRSLFHYGVEIDGLRYNHQALAPLRDRLKRGEKVKVKYHPADISYVYIYNPLDRDYIRAPAVNQTYAQGLSRWKHNLIRSFLRVKRRQVNQEGLAWAKRQMRDIVAEAKVRQRRNRSRKRVARWETNGRSAQNLLEEHSPGITLEGEANEVKGLDLAEQVPPQLANLRLHFTVEELEAEGWRTTRE